ncbi:MAG: response regulator [Pseudomonadales bacterium]|nr:response regulator [Pseudomonadales bacterium]
MEVVSAQARVTDRLNVLVVDDSTAIRSLITAKLHELAADSYELEIAQAADGLQALSHAQQHPFDLIFLDVEMPGMGGLEACSRLREQGCPARIAMLSSMTSAEAHLAGREAGCDNYLVKPPHDGDLRSILRLASLRKQTTR